MSRSTAHVKYAQKKNDRRSSVMVAALVALHGRLIAIVLADWKASCSLRILVADDSVSLTEESFGTINPIEVEKNGSPTMANSSHLLCTVVSTAPSNE